MPADSQVHSDSDTADADLIGGRTPENTNHLWEHTISALVLLYIGGM